MSSISQVPILHDSADPSPQSPVSKPVDCLGTSTWIRVDGGNKRVGQLELGDLVFNHLDRAVPITRIDPPVQANTLYEIAFTSFGSPAHGAGSSDTILRVTPDHILDLINTIENTVSFPRKPRDMYHVHFHARCVPPCASASADPPNNSSYSPQLRESLRLIRGSLLSPTQCQCGGLRRLTRDYVSKAEAYEILAAISAPNSALDGTTYLAPRTRFTITAKDLTELRGDHRLPQNIAVWRVPPPDSAGHNVIRHRAVDAKHFTICEITGDHLAARSFDVPGDYCQLESRVIMHV